MEIWIIFVGIVPQRLAIPGDGKLRLVAQCREARETKPETAELWLDQKTLAVLKKHYPCMADSVTSVPSKNHARVKSHREHLAPSPEGEILAVARFAFLEFLWWLPVFFFAKQFFIGDSTTTAEKLANFFQSPASDSQRLADIAAHRKCWAKAFAAVKRLRDLFPMGVVGFRDCFCDHKNRILSRRLKENDHREHWGHTGKEKLATTTENCSYTGTGTFSMISFSTSSDCSDFLSVDA